mmetsp:Transcript_9373/g.16604  ORF Transcript_9373/g.16604 Transcript_9373/m.16604 type:complete len:189 (-) Transcript_9373:114-680(-)|eukprot:CAMPEP_0197650338 /NCGR_PEP_ID=MMETSP1338-20131121/30882_1 /TAXON_ID=43686 ORGANISM="Pelagodinium beii, Strain RCC1491" /NCGR_SAMPLE_ID=MMETSP1338 /ASSEMBLY_ACC=CAM_ASM_000754 /LENGTH=188 /DNA_ID=CAMNT_0043224725 /DNA_START=98 /DNA_END=664 /DNA_ORIENTATION=+
MAIAVAETTVAVPLEGGDELYAKYFAEVTLDVVEEETFKKRTFEEPGPRYVHLRRSAIGTVTVPPHVEENKSGEINNQVWTGHPKVDRTLFIMDRRAEHQHRDTKSVATQKNIPMLRGNLGKKNFGTKLGHEPFLHSHRSARMNGPLRPPFATLPPTHMDTMVTTPRVRGKNPNCVSKLKRPDWQTDP